MFNGTAIAWLSQKQTLPAASSTEAEIYALSEATRLGLWFLQMMNEAHISGLDYFVVMQDNEATIKIAENPSSTQRTKHIDVRHNIINESITSGQMVLQHVFSSQMWADFQRNLCLWLHTKKHASTLGCDLWMNCREQKPRGCKSSTYPYTLEPVRLKSF